jgi:ketosteroid isomerase-like protein
MSEEDVEVVRQAFDALNARDTNRALSLMDPEIEYRSAFVPALAPKTYRGPAEMLQWREDMYAVMKDFHIEDSRFIDAGAGRVVALYRVVSRGAGSGVPVTQEVGALWQLRNRKLHKGEVFLDPRDALEAAGLSK